jgi:hypothetical protein
MLILASKLTVETPITPGNINKDGLHRVPPGIIPYGLYLIAEIILDYSD